MDYMKLLVTQLQNQNPLEPMSNDQMAAQLAQFSQLEQLESMNTNFAKVLETSEHSYATSLIGKSITFLGMTEAGTTEAITGTVGQVYKGSDGKIALSVGNYSLALDDILSVQN
jgi:flagellar basal-body rod modification protein FlgD